MGILSPLSPNKRALNLEAMSAASVAPVAQVSPVSPFASVPTLHSNPKSLRGSFYKDDAKKYKIHARFLRNENLKYPCPCGAVFDIPRDALAHLANLGVAEKAHHGQKVWPK
jgi:hypothetical protein